ncbi:uncharacterized protein [Dysidea avara]|uniref:uncharacterized protein n=1 Tax=Dysidea avara TaxID=196820 RepID=UPI0033266ED0
MQRIHSAKSDFHSGDVAQQGSTTFLVKSKGAVDIIDVAKKWWYNVELGSDSVFPSCECADFQRNYLPCKHFFAIFHLMPGYSWESLPQYFRNNTFVTIDDSFILHCTDKKYSSTSYHNTTEDTSEILCSNDALDTDSTSSNETITDTFNEPHGIVNSVDAYDNGSNASLDLSPSPQNEQRPSQSVKIMSEKLHSNLTLLVDFSYTSKDYESIKNINNQIIKVLRNAMITLPTKENLPLRCSPKKKKHTSIITKKYSNLRSLPMKKRNKKLTLYEKYKNRVGVFADKVKQASHVHIDGENQILVALKIFSQSQPSLDLLMKVL